MIMKKKETKGKKLQSEHQPLKSSEVVDLSKDTLESKNLLDQEHDVKEQATKQEPITFNVTFFKRPKD